MEKINIKSNNATLDISPIALGCLSYHMEEFRQDNFRTMDEYMALGGNTFDNARIYGGGESEFWLGNYFKQNGKREQAIITSKCAHHDMQTREKRVNSECIIADVETSLSKLGTDYIDILFLHRDDIYKPVEEIMPTLDKLVKSGKVRMLGASNWSCGRIQKANEFALANGLSTFGVSQICYALAMTTPSQSGDLTHICMDECEKAWYRESKMPVMSWSPNCRGFIPQVLAGEVKERTMRWYGWCEENFLRAKRAEEIAEKHHCSVGAVVLAYISCQDFPVCPVVSFSQNYQFHEAMESIDIQLSKQDLHYLSCGKK